MQGKRIHIFTTLLMLFALVPAAAHAEEMRIAVLPFVTHSETDITYLQKAIPSMLATRLGESGELAVVDRSEVLEQVLFVGRGPDLHFGSFIIVSRGRAHASAFFGACLCCQTVLNRIVVIAIQGKE